MYPCPLGLPEISGAHVRRRLCRALVDRFRQEDRRKAGLSAVAPWGMVRPSIVTNIMVPYFDITTVSVTSKMLEMYAGTCAGHYITGVLTLCIAAV